MLGRRTPRGRALLGGGSRGGELSRAEVAHNGRRFVVVFWTRYLRDRAWHRALCGGRVRLSKAEKLKLVAKARFGRHTEENILAKRDRDRRTGGAVGGRRAG